MSILSAMMPASLRQRIDHWIASRNPPTREAIKLHNRRLYILPTRFGYLFVFMLIVLLLAAINYQNSMAFALTFLLTALGIISLWKTHHNLLGLSVKLKSPQPVFQGELLHFQFELKQSVNLRRYAIGIQYQQTHPAYTSVSGETATQLELTVPAIRRGQFRPDGFTLFTRYPTGLFHAWSWLRFDLPVTIYPTPHYELTLRESLDQDEDSDFLITTQDGDDFAGLREHRSGESLKHISWKAYAQGRGMLTKTFQGHAQPALWIDWSQMTSGSVEGKLSQMTALVVQAQQQGRVFGLRLPGNEISQSSGKAHLGDCLQQLSTFRQHDRDSLLDSEISND